MNPVAAVVLGSTVAGVIVRQLWGRGPPIWSIFLVGAFATIATGVLPTSGAAGAIASNVPVLVFLFALFVFAAALEQAGALDHLARWIVGRVRRPDELPPTLFVAFGLLSAFVLNDALVLVGVPLLLAVARRSKVPPTPLLLTLMFGVTVGSVLTPFGNPQNLLVSLDSGLAAPVVTFLRYLLLPTAANLIVGALLLRRSFRRELGPAGDGGCLPAPSGLRFFPRGPLGPLLARAPALAIFPATVVALITVDVTSVLARGPPVPLYTVAFGGAVLTLVASPGRARLLARVDTSILLLFAALFVVVAGAARGGVLQGLETIVPVPGPGSGNASTIGLILLTSLGGSQLVSNVPWVGLQIPALHALGYGPSTPLAWVALASGSTLAGNLTLLGAASNLIVVEQAERAGVRIRLGQFFRTGAPMAAVTVAVLYLCLVVAV